MSDREPILIPRGILQLNARKSNPSTQSKKSEAAKQIASMNTRQYLYQNFFAVDFLYRGSPNNKSGIVQTINPTAPYGYGGVMVVAADAEFLRDVTEPGTETDRRLYPSKTIYEYDKELQIEYFMEILAAYEAMSDTRLPGEFAGTAGKGFKVIATENTTADISNETIRIGRSIALPHFHIFKIGSWINEEDQPSTPHHLSTERKFLEEEKISTSLRLALGTGLRLLIPDIREDIGLDVRLSPPHGYTISTGIDQKPDLAEQAQRLQKIMHANHQAYAALVLESLDFTDKARKAKRNKVKPVKNLVIPQPSYRTYLRYDVSANQYLVTISPEIVSSSGAIDATGMMLSRDPKYASLYSPEELVEFSKYLQDKIHYKRGATTQPDSQTA
jgi:hypothetical protein